MKEKIILVLFILIIPFVGKAETKYLYDVLKEEAESNGLAKQYTYAHQDSMNPLLSTENIYHWYASNEEEGNAIRNKFNVLFAGHCWQMIRTTDTGGVRLLYNGEAKNNQCLYDRPYHIASIRDSKSTVNGTGSPSSYYYGTDYSFDETTGRFSLAGDITLEKWTPSNAPNLIGKYTFFTWFQNGHSQMFQVTGYEDDKTAKVKFYQSDVYTSVGTSRFHIGVNDYISYMVNRPFGDTRRSELSPKSIRLYNSYGYDRDYFFFDSYTYDNDRRTYSYAGNISHLENEQYSDLVGKYTFLYTEEDFEDRPSDPTYVYYVVHADEYGFYYYSITNNESLDSGTQYYVFEDYTNNGNNTYTAINPTVYTRRTFYDNYSIISDKFVCFNAVDNVCEEVFFVTYTYPDTLFYASLQYNYKYASSFEYENGTYHLTGDSFTTYNLGSRQDDLKTYRYTCWNLEGTCEKLSYILAYDFWGGPRYVEMENGQDIDDYLNNVLYADDVNAKSTAIKEHVDTWYEDNMLEYTKYLEDTIYCGNRSIIYRSSWGGNNSLSPYLRFGDCPGWSSSLNCPKETDRYSRENPKAQLKYPVALLSAPEATILGHKSVRVSPSTYFLLSPGEYINGISPSSVNDEGLVAINYSGNRTVRPVISLKQDAQIKSGNGSMENPYVVTFKDYYSVNVEIKNETEELDIEIEDLTKVEEGDEVVFKVTPIKGYKINNIHIITEDNNDIIFDETNNKNEYIFIMPNQNVTIIPSYERVSNEVKVEDNSHTKEIIIKVNDVKAVVYEDVVQFTVIPEEGYEVETIIIKDESDNEIEYHKTNKENEYEFIMPDSNVTIIPIYRRKPVEDIVNPNTGRKFLWIGILLTLGLLTGTLYKKQKMKV